MSLKDAVRWVYEYDLSHAPEPDVCSIKKTRVLPVEVLRARLEKVQQVCREFGDYRGEVEMAKMLAELEGLK